MRVDLRDPVVSEIYNLGMEEGKEIRTWEVLEIIDEIERDIGHTALIGDDNKFVGVLCNSSEFREAIWALKGGKHEDSD